MSSMVARVPLLPSVAVTGTAGVKVAPPPPSSSARRRSVPAARSITPEPSDSARSLARRLVSQFGRSPARVSTWDMTSMIVAPIAERLISSKAATVSGLGRPRRCNRRAGGISTTDSSSASAIGMNTSRPRCSAASTISAAISHSGSGPGASGLGGNSRF